MDGGRAALRVCLGLAVALAALLGCTDGRGGITGYLVNRYQDACDTIDLGMTVSARPQFAAYVCAASIVPAGYGRVEGEFLGIGRGQIGTVRYYEASWGVVLRGVETLGWGGKYDPRDVTTLSQQGVGLIGLVLGPGKARRPGAVLASVAYLHLGHVGGVASANSLEIVDFALGWFGIDLLGDDGQGRPFGHWPWQRVPAKVVGEETETEPGKKPIDRGP